MLPQKRQAAKAVFLLALFFQISMMTSCSGEPAGQWLKAPGWSRARALGVAGTADPAPIVVDQSGQIYLAWFVDSGAGQMRPHVAAFDRTLTLAWEKTVANPLPLGDDPHLIWDGQQLHFFWLGERQLFYQAFTATGTVVGDVRILSGSLAVDDYAAAVDGAGRLSVWFAGPRREPGLYAFAPGTLSAPRLIDPEGVRPSMQYDQDDVLHVSWAHYPPSATPTAFLYAAFPAGELVDPEVTVYQTPVILATTILEGPYLGLAGGEIYAFWSLDVRTGLEAGRLDTAYVVIDPDAATQPGAQILNVPYTDDLNYMGGTQGAGFAAGPRYNLSDNAIPTTAEVSGVDVLKTGDELVIAYNVQVEYLYRKVKGQVATTFFEAGRPVGFQLLSYSAPNSVAAALASDDNGYLYVTWQENAAAGNQIWLASTAPDVVAANERLTGADVGQLLLQSAFGLLSGMLLAPFAVGIWLVAPLIVVVASGFVGGRRRDEMGPVLTIVSLMLAVAAYWMGKLFSLPGIRTYVPFSAWLPDISPFWGAVLRVGVPLTATALALYLAYHFTYRRSSPSVMFFMLIFATIDGLVTMAVYGLLILGGA